MGWTTAGGRTLSEVRPTSLHLRGKAAQALRNLRQVALRMPERALPELWQDSLYLPKEAKSEGKAGRRQGTYHPAHDDDNVLASGRNTHVRPTIHGIALRKAA